jgi:hypothetical protein
LINIKNISNIEASTLKQKIATQPITITKKKQCRTSSHCYYCTWGAADEVWKC